MNYLELRTKIVDQAHRKDMNARVPGFIEDARTRINLRLGLALEPLVADTDTNEILADWWPLYFYAAMVALYEFIIEMETATYFDNRYQEYLASYYITRAGQESLTITPEEPMP